jgi:hypothetical protein
MPFPVLRQEDHSRIGEVVRRTVEGAQEAEAESRRLLERAKRRVEELVEKEAKK